jgi:hypothetical protein
MKRCTFCRKRYSGALDTIFQIISSIYEYDQSSFNSCRIKNLFIYLLPRRFLVFSPVQYDRRSFTVEKIGVGVGMRGRAQRYINASCPSDISETSCLSRVRPARQEFFHVFRPEKRIPAGKSYISARCASGTTTSIVFAWKWGELHNRLPTQ